MASNLSLMAFYDSRDSFCNVALDRIEDLRQTSRHVREVPGAAMPVLDHGSPHPAAQSICWQWFFSA